MSDNTTDQSPDPIKSDGSIFSRPPEVSAPTDATTVISPPTKSAPMTMSSRWRWAVVALATVLVVGLVGAVFVLGQPKNGAPSTVSLYAPANAAVYMEARLDFPGDQHNLIAQFMSHFPGFADQAAFDTKLDETLDSVFSRNAAGLSWTQNVKPWFGGQVGMFTTDLSPTASTPPSVTIVLNVKDRNALQTQVSQWTGSGLPAPSGSIPLVTEETYQGVVIYTLPATANTERGYVAATDDAVLIGTTVADLEAALDAHANRSPGLADDTDFLAQLGKLHDDRLGMFYLNSSSFMAAMPSSSPAATACLSDLTTGAANLKMVGEARAESDHLVLTTRVDSANTSLSAPAGYVPANLAQLAPANTVAFFELPQLGKTVTTLLTGALNCAQTSSGFDLTQLKTLLGSDPEKYFDFVGDAAVVVSQNGTTYGGGIVATVDDDVTANARVQQLIGYLRPLAALGGFATIDTQQHGAASVTVITFTSPSADLPFKSLAVSEYSGHLYIGLDDFVTTALDQTAATSLSAQPRWLAGLAAGGTGAYGQAFVDITAIRGALEAQIPAADQSNYQVNAQPFLAPLDYLMVDGGDDGGVGVSNAFLYVK